MCSIIFLNTISINYSFAAQIVIKVMLKLEVKSNDVKLRFGSYLLAKPHITENITAILEKGLPSYQILIPRLPKKSRQHFIARHFFRAHKYRTGV
jgi:hypothetical protein